MIFERKLHPVGQGAFFTEHIFNNITQYSSTIVYDCGSTSSKEQLHITINKFKQEYDSFNLLFISHFDDDHVNGLKWLLEKDLLNNDDIEMLVKTYSFDKSTIKNLILQYFIEKYPDESDSILKSKFKDVVERYSIDKTTVEDLVCGFKDFVYLRYLENGGDIENWNLLEGEENATPEDEVYISGFVPKYLEQQRKKSQPHKVVIIPFLYPNLIRILLPEMRNELSEDTFNALDVLFHSGIKIIGLDENDSYRGNFEIHQIDKDMLYENDQRTIKSNTKIKVKESKNGKVCWYYLPFNTIVDDGRKERFLVELVLTLKRSTGKIGEWFREKMGDQINSINDVNDIKNNDFLKEIQNFLMDGVSNFLTDKETIKGFVNLLKGLYNNKNVSSGIRGVTAINVNSLNVLSYCENEIMNNSSNTESVCWCKKLGESFPSRDENGIGNRYYCEQMRFYKYSCLYTGDCVMEGHFFDCIKFIHDSVLGSSIGLLQIPHHGSKHNYNEQIQFTPIFSTFVNFKQGTYSFADGIYSLGKKIPCFEVTQEKDSEYWHIIIYDIIS